MNLIDREADFEFNFSEEELLVLFDWLARFNQGGQRDLHEAEKRVLWDLESSIEKALPQVLAQNYKESVLQARMRISPEK